MSWQIGHPIKRDGTSQTQRLLDALRPEHNPIDGRQREDLLLFIYKMSRQFAFYNAANEIDNNDRDWHTFFSAFQNENGQVTLESIRKEVKQMETRQDNPAFLTILLAFLDMFGHVQQDLNSLSKKHLDFYYEQVLGFRRLAARPDVVHVLFELAPQVDQHRIPVGTALKAGNDDLGNPLTYLVNREIILNKTQLSSIKTTLVTDDGRVYAAEIANSADGLGAPLLNEPKRWPTFGHPANMQLSSVGFSIASPLLFLKEGKRIINLTLKVKEVPDELTENELQTFLPYGSGAEDWIKLEMQGRVAIDRQAKTISLTIVAQPEQEAIVLNNDLAKYPALGLILDPEQPSYHQMKQLELTEINLSVEVIASQNQPGLRDLVLQNDAGLLDNEGAFLPFGDEPSKNALFYIGSQEAFSKPLNALSMQLRWADLPDTSQGFVDHYKEYGTAYQSNTKFAVDFQLLNGSQWSNLFARNTRVFQLDSNSKLVPDVNLSVVNSKLQSLPLNEDIQQVDDLDLGHSQGFIRMSLNQDFGHRLYNHLFALVARDGGDFPNLPYTPTLQSLSLGYKASQTISFGADNLKAQFFHIQPFGSEEIPIENTVQLLPQLPQGALYLGLEGLEPPQNLHLLFQLAEGSAATTNVVEKSDISWDYLTKDGWRTPSLSGAEIFIDTTLGLQKSGIMAFNIGRDATKEGGLLPAGMHWLRAIINKNPSGAAQTIQIHPQVTTAVFANNDNDSGHLLQALPAKSISALVERDSAVSKVEQPYASFGGAPAEPDRHFYTRISERLRHKKRAISLWDMERLALQQFPSLYEVKAIPHTGFVPQPGTADTRGFYSEFQPGQVTVVVIPQLRNQNAVNPLQPSASVALLKEVKQYLVPLTTRFVGGEQEALHIINPFYEPIQLAFSVGFREGFDAGFYAVELNNALRRHLSPWAFEEGQDIRFGGKLYKSQLLAFVEEQEYVDYVTDFKMLHGNTGPGVGEMCVDIDFTVRSNTFGEDTDIAIASTAASILVSADQHLIKVLQPDTFPCDEPQVCSEGVGCWFVDIDFVVT